MKLYVLVVDIFEPQSAGMQYPVVRHSFPGRSCDEAVGYFKAHIGTCAFLSGCVKTGRFKSIECVVEAHWELVSNGQVRIVSAPADMPDGLSTGLGTEDFNPYWLAVGTCVEMEHTGDVAIAQRIAMDHLVEDEMYYEKLEAAGL